MQLTNSERLVVETMGMNEKSALEYLEKHGYKRSRMWWFSKKKYLNNHAREILSETGINFEARHLERAESFYNLRRLSYENLEKETDTIRRQNIINSISKLEYDIALIDEATRDILEGNGLQISKDKEKQEQVQSLPA